MSKPKKHFHRRPAKGNAAADDNDTEKEYSSISDKAILQYESGDPTSVKRWAEKWGLRADQKFTGLSSIFLLDRLPTIRQIKTPNTPWNDANDPHHIQRSLQNEEVKRVSRKTDELEQASSTLFTEMLEHISPAGIQAIKTYIHLEKVKQQQQDYDNQHRMQQKAIAIYNHRQEIRSRRAKRQRRQLKTTQKAEQLASTSTDGAMGAVVGAAAGTRSKKGKGKLAKADKEDEPVDEGTQPEPTGVDGGDNTTSSSTAASSAAGATSSAAAAPSSTSANVTKRIIIVAEDSDTEDEVIPDDDDDLEDDLHHINEVDMDPENAWNEFRARCDALDLWLAVKMTHVVKKSGNSVTDANEATKRYWTVKMSPSHTLDRYYEIWSEVVNGFKATHNGRLPGPEDEMAQQFIESLDASRWGEMQAQCKNDSQSWDQTIRNNAYPSSVNQAYVSASQRVSAAMNYSDNRKPPLAMAVIAKLPTAKSKKATMSIEADKKKKDDPQPASEDKRVKFADNGKGAKDKDVPKSRKPPGECIICSEQHWSSQCPELQACRALVRSKSAKPASTHLITLCTSAKSLAVDKTIKTNSNLSDNIIIDDNASDVHIFRNRALLSNVREAEEYIELTGINQSGAGLLCTEVGDFGEITPVYISDSAATNVLSHAMLEDAFPMEYKQGESITYKMEHENLKFNRIGNRYIHVSEVKNTLISSVRENMEGYSKREIKRAEQARDLTDKLNNPGESTVERALKLGTWDNVGVTVHDLHRAKAIHGPDVPGLKGRTTRPKPSEMIIDSARPIPHQRQGILSVDLMIIEKSTFVIGVIDQIGMTLSQYIRNRSSSALLEALNVMIATCEEQGWTVNIRSDNEKSIAAVVNYLRTKNYKTRVDFVAPGRKVPIVERKIRTIEEKTRAVIARLPYMLPLFIVKWLVANVVATDNMMPSNSGHVAIGENRCPREIFLGKRIDVKKDLRIKFGQYVQLYNPNIPFINSMQARTRGAIALGTIPGTDGVTRFWVLATNRIVTASKWVEIPIDDTIISHINSIANNIGRSQDDPMVTEEIETAEEHAVETDSQQEQDEVDGHITVTEYTPKSQIAPLPLTAPEVTVGIADIPDIPAAVEQASEMRRSERATKGKAAERYTYTTNKVGKTRTTMRRYVFNISSSKAIKEHGKPVIEAIANEIEGILKYDTLRSVNPAKLTRDERRKIMRSKLFLKMKKHPDGTFDKWKARLVAGGDSQDRSQYSIDETSSPTVALWAVYALAALRKKGSTVKTIDIKQAYLNAVIGSRELLMRIQPDVAAIITDIVPAWSEDLDKDGSLIVKLHKALYGCVESAKLFYDHLRKTLNEIGYEPLKSDPCVYLKRQHNDTSLVMTHVDDLHIISDTPQLADEIQKHLEGVYGAVNVQDGLEHNYLGMHFSYCENGSVKITMDGYISETLKEYGITEKDISRYPANQELFTINETSPPLSTSDQELFRSRVMKLMYLGIRIRPDLLTALAYLSTRLTKASEDDKKKLHQVYAYLNHTTDLFLTLTADEPVQLNAWIDASLGVHQDYKGHTGGVLTLGKGVLHAKSTKQKINSKSSTESELIGVSDYLSNVLQLRGFLEEIGYQLGPARLHQDNQSTMKLLAKGRPASDSTRHIAMRYFFAKDRVDNGEIEFIYCPTDDMLADTLTKPLVGKAFFKHRHALLNLPGTSDRRGVLRFE